MKGYADEVWEGLTAPERERLEARYRAFAKGAAALRRLNGEEREPCWAPELEVRR